MHKSSDQLYIAVGGGLMVIIDTEIVFKYIITFYSITHEDGENAHQLASGGHLGLSNMATRGQNQFICRWFLKSYGQDYSL